MKRAAGECRSQAQRCYAALARDAMRVQGAEFSTNAQSDQSVSPRGRNALNCVVRSGAE
jgi:hypothetical protein